MLRSLSVAMPNSIDIAVYEKALFLEESGERAGSSSASTSDNGEHVLRMIHRTPKSRTRKIFSCTRSPWMYFLDLCLIGLVVILATRKASEELVQLQGDITGLVPRFDQQVTTFRSHPEFISNHTSLESLRKAQEAWVDFLPRKSASAHLNPVSLTI